MALPKLSPDDFRAFFRAVQTWTEEERWAPACETFDPFPWQARLAAEIAADDRWPDLLDLPTGSGKTVVIDVAVFLLALQAGRGEARRAAMRICFVVDRRLVVDEAFNRARRLAAALQASCTDADAPDVLRRVALRLRHLAGDDQPPLVARALRGGAPREDDWARTPCQPTVLCSTVDQVGSRLLFRGYGVSDRMKPIHAGLLGSDALILLDEAHLSQPFRQTARAIAAVPALRGPDAGRSTFHVALLTATPGDQTAGERRFGLAPDDRTHPILRARMTASKPATLLEVGADDDARSDVAARAALGLIETLHADGVEAPVVGVVVNRIARARAIFDRLSASMGAEAVRLVIGRARPVDRDRIAIELEPIKTRNFDPSQSDSPVRTPSLRIIVATQTLEAGVDIDLDGLVTDAASLDALRQRFGRVNRAGRPIGARGVILASKADLAGKKPDPIYGDAISKTLNVLFPEGAENVDFGIDAMDSFLAAGGHVGPGVLPLLSDKADAPVLMPAYVDLWTHTSPIPAADPEAALFLHGPNREPASVQLIWRADLDLNLDRDLLIALLSLAPPRSTEAIELPVWAVRRWLEGEARIDLGDVSQVEATEVRAEAPKGPAFRWMGRDSDRSQVIPPAAIRAGDTIIVPSSYRGCDRYGWSPRQKDWVRDEFDRANAAFQSRGYVVRVAPGLILQAVRETATVDADGVESAEVREERLERVSADIGERVRRVLNEAGPSARASDLVSALQAIVPEPLKGQLAKLPAGGLSRPVFPYDTGENRHVGVVFTARRVAALAEAFGAVSTEDDESGSFVGRAQSLIEHSTDVQNWARDLAARAGLAPGLAHDLSLAGWLHDAGKADPRFQRLLHDGDLLAMEERGPLAKSAHGRSRRGAWEAAKLPAKWRHEALSVRLALENPRLAEANDRGLVLWLVGVHHGLGRPFFPHSDPLDGCDRVIATVEGLSVGSLSAAPGPQWAGFAIPEEDIYAARNGRTFIDDDLRGLDWATLFRDLKQRYGPWGLARLEAVLRLADHRASEAAMQPGRGA